MGRIFSNVKNRFKNHFKRSSTGFQLFALGFTLSATLFYVHSSNQNFPSLLDHVEDMVLKPDSDETSSITPKMILLWTPWFGDSTWAEIFNLLDNHRPILSLADDYNNADKRTCTLTTDRSLISQSDAVIFHGRDFDEHDLPHPATRQVFQSYVFLSLESPPMLFQNDMWQILRDTLSFNLTASYTAKADVRFTYGRLVPGYPENETESRNKISRFVKNFATRPKDAVWIVSHCEAESKRDEIVKKLQSLGLAIDIFGECSGLKAPSWNATDKFFANYRYYLSFENSLCDDYVTEKLFRGLKLSIEQGVIPIAYGGKVDYKELGIPTRSFINARDYLPGNLTALARFLTKILPQNETLLAEHFAWHLTNRFGLKTFVYSWRKLCERLWLKDPDHADIVDDVEATFGQCSAPPLNF